MVSKELMKKTPMGEKFMEHRKRVWLLGRNIGMLSGMQSGRLRRTWNKSGKGGQR